MRFLAERAKMAGALWGRPALGHYPTRFADLLPGAPERAGGGEKLGKRLNPAMNAQQTTA
jgi:hypothetical protein